MSDITREDAVKWLTNLREDCGRYQDLWPYGEALEQIIKLLDTDVAPVRHGMWVDVDRMQMHDIHGVLTWGNSFMCTECNFKTFAVEGHMSQYHYCPNCGARMDGERKNDDKSCDTCKHYDKGWDDIICDGCTKAHSNWERRDDEIDRR